MSGVSDFQGICKVYVHPVPPTLISHGIDLVDVFQSVSQAALPSAVAIRVHKLLPFSSECNAFTVSKAAVGGRGACRHPTRERMFGDLQSQNSFCSHPIGACCMLSGRLQGFIPRKWTHLQDHILTLHTACPYPVLISNIL
jgi:hypothetical protein